MAAGVFEDLAEVDFLLMEFVSPLAKNTLDLSHPLKVSEEWRGQEGEG
jgi:hypothetical protein